LAQLQEIDSILAITILPADSPESTRELTEFIHNICPPSFALKKNFSDIKKSLMASPKNTKRGNKNTETGLKVILGGKCFRQSAAGAH